jgi:hypothetical protein
LNSGKDLIFCPGIRKPNLNALPDFQGLDYLLVKNWQVGYECEYHTILFPSIFIMRTRLKIGINVLGDFVTSTQHWLEPSRITSFQGSD